MYREIAIAGLGTLWVSEADGSAARIPADGCADIILRDDELVVAGPSTRWVEARGSARLPTVGLRFAPGFAGAALAIDPTEARDRVLPASELLAKEVRERGERALRSLLVPGALREAAATIPRELGMDLDPTQPARVDLRWIPEVRAAARREEPFARLSARLGYSERQLRRRMLHTFGYGYAALRRVLRSERARDLIGRGVTLAEAAELAGYADQSHLAREFARVIGVTPSQLAAAKDSRRREQVGTNKGKGRTKARS